MRLKAYITALHAALFAILLTVSPAGSGSMMLLGAGKAGGVLPGPPIFTAQNVVNASVASNVLTYTGFNTGTASANRFVVVTIGSYGGFSSATITSAVFSAGSVSANFAQMTNSGNGTSTMVVWAVVPTGTTSDLVLTLSAGQAQPNPGFCYTSDVTTLSSTTPVTAGAAVTTGTSQSTSIAVANNGSALFFVGAGNGLSSQSITASDAGLTTDTPFGQALFAHANNVAATGASNVTEGWTTSANNSIGLVVFR